MRNLLVWPFFWNLSCFHWRGWRREDGRMTQDQQIYTCQGYYPTRSAPQEDIPDRHFFFFSIFSSCQSSCHLPISRTLSKRINCSYVYSVRLTNVFLCRHQSCETGMLVCLELSREKLQGKGIPEAFIPVGWETWKCVFCWNQTNSEVKRKIRWGW